LLAYNLLASKVIESSQQDSRRGEQKEENMKRIFAFAVVLAALVTGLGCIDAVSAEEAPVISNLTIDSPKMKVSEVKDVAFTFTSDQAPGVVYLQFYGGPTMRQTRSILYSSEKEGEVKVSVTDKEGKKEVTAVRKTTMPALPGAVEITVWMVSPQGKQSNKLKANIEYGM